MANDLPIQAGNAINDNQRGWFVDHFIDESLGLRHRTDLEIKWGDHQSGEGRKEWTQGETRKVPEHSVMITVRWPSLP